MSKVLIFILLIISFSCATKKDYATINKNCKINNEIFELGKDSMRIDTSLYANILTNKDSVISTQGNKRKVYRKTFYSNFPEVLYIILKRLPDEGIEINSFYHKSGKLLKYELNKYNARDGYSGLLSQKTAKFDKKGNRVSHSERGDLSYFDNIKIKDSIDISTIKDTTSNNYFKNDTVAYRSDPPKNLRTYSKKIIDTSTGLSKEYLYDQNGNYMGSSYSIKTQEVPFYPEIRVSTSEKKIINYEKGYNICFQEAIDIVKKAGRKEIRKYKVSEFIVGRNVLDKFPNEKPVWTITLIRDKNLNLPDEKTSRKEKVIYSSISKIYKIDGKTGKVIGYKYSYINSNSVYYSELYK